VSKARERLSEQFISALEADYLAHGDTALERVRREEPKAYLRLVSELTSKQSEVKVESNEYSSWSLDELRGFILGIESGGSQEGHEARLEAYLEAHLLERERIIRNLKRDIKKGLRPPSEYHSMSAGDQWRVNHGRKPKLAVVDTD
jgi:hypothetical protein